MSYVSFCRSLACVTSAHTSIEQTTDFNMNLFDGSYDPFMNGVNPPLPLGYGADLFNINAIDNFSWDEYAYLTSGYMVNNAPAEVAPATCNPADVMPPPINWEDFLQDDLAEALATGDFDPTPTTVNPPQLMTPPQSLPSTPLMIAKPLLLDSSNIGLLTPPSDKPVYRTRRFDASDSIRLLSQLNLNAPSTVEQTVNPGCFTASPAYTSGVPDNSAMSAPFLFGYTPTSSATSSGASSSHSNSFRGSPPPIRRASHATGVQRVTASDLRRANKKLQPVPTSDPERPHGCRHPGRNPGDLPCNLDFARKHDWSRHQVSPPPLRLTFRY